MKFMKKSRDFSKRRSNVSIFSFSNDLLRCLRKECQSMIIIDDVTDIELRLIVIKWKF